MNRLFVNQLTVVDFSYLHPERGLLGESWQVDVILSGLLDEQGMVFDFAEVKKQVKQLIDTEFDHRLLIPLYSPHLSFQPLPSDRVELRFTTVPGEVIHLSCPAQAIGALATAAVDPASLANAILELLWALLPANVVAVDIDLHPEPTTGAYFHYSHGLRQHRGNCQRIAHGHRSRLEIMTNHQRNPELEQQWAERWRDIYIATTQDLQSQFEYQGQAYWQFAYTAAQGDFALSLPASRCYLVETDSTIENLANHLCGVLATAHPHQPLQVRLFEGINKGAMAVSGE